ncbi:MAG: glycosyltransferase [Verrucomicrobiota bacterium]
MDIPEGVHLELRVVDNDEEGSAKKVVDAYRTGKTQPFQEIHYAVESRQNIAHARNACLDMGISDVVIFVDDDEEVIPSWLEALWSTFQTTEADAVLGPVYGRYSSDCPNYLARGRFFDKTTPPTGTQIDWKSTRTSNTLVAGTWFYDRNFRFDPAFGRSGGSDSNLFARMEKEGARYVSCREAEVWEDVPSSRATIRWLTNRFYRNGIVFEQTVKILPEAHPILRVSKRLLQGSCLMVAGALVGLVRQNWLMWTQGRMRWAIGCGGLVGWCRPSTQFVEYDKKEAPLPFESQAA